MTVTLIGGSTALPVDRNGHRYRITWRFVAAPFVPNGQLETQAIAVALRDALPPNGMVAVSPVAALPGDPFIQYTVQLTQLFPGYTLADVVKFANKLPLFPVGGTSLRLALEVSEVEVRASNLSSTIVRAQDEASRQRALTEASKAEVQTQIAETVSSAGSALWTGTKDVLKLVLGAVVLVGVAYVVVRYKR